MAQAATEKQWESLRAREAALLAEVGIPITTNDITVHGQSMHYLEAGNPKLPTLIMLHGRGSAAALWYSIMPQLARHRHLIAIDMPGWGLSSRAPFAGTTPQSALDWWRDGVLGAIDALGVQRFDLIGHSLGGMVSLAVALQRQTQLDHLLLEDAAGFTTHYAAFYRLYFRAGPERLAKIAPRSLFDRASAGSAPAPTDASPALRAALSDFVYTLTTFPGTQESAVRAFDTIFDLNGVHLTLRDRVPTIMTPTRAIWGANDPLIPLRYCQAAIATMPHSEVVIIPKVVHSPHMESPVLFAEHALEFLARGVEAPVTVRDAN